MVKSVYPVNKEVHAYGGHFLVGEYSPARRSPPLPVIPARASAHPAAVTKVRPRYPRWTAEMEQEDVTRMPTVPRPETIWQFETPRYAAESSLASLTLAVTDSSLMARPSISRVPTVPRQKCVRPVAEHDTSIVARLREHHIDDIDTVPPLLSSPVMLRRPKASILHPIEGIRWWLIQPGRLEFLLWLGGTIVLIGLTVVFVLFILSSLGYLAIH
ncbi:hypothetical protein [Dictyobacter aurantiacus]|nr:hypothetical protein [Dictyobacter aurantiacus]